MMQIFSELKWKEFFTEIFAHNLHSGELYRKDSRRERRRIEGKKGRRQQKRKTSVWSVGLWTHPAPSARWLTFLYLTARTRPGVITFSSLLPVFPSWSEDGVRICEGEGEDQSSGLRATLLAFPWSQWTISLMCYLSVSVFLVLSLYFVPNFYKNCLCLERVVC